MKFEEWFNDYAPTAPEYLDDCAKDAWFAAVNECREAVAKAFDKYPILATIGCTKAMTVATEAIDTCV